MLRLLAKVPVIKNKTKILISFSLLVLALTLSILHPQAIDYKLCFYAMIFSFLGDISLNALPIEKRSHTLLYTGAFFFMISHLIYAQAYISLNLPFAFFNFGFYFAFGLMLILISISLISIKKSRKTVSSSTLLVFSIYALMISINFISIYSYSWNFKALSFIGATSFLISDYIIGIETILKIKNDVLRKLVWIFYPIGQIMILVCR